MSTVVLYCWCHSDSASVLLYFTLMKSSPSTLQFLHCFFQYFILMFSQKENETGHKLHTECLSVFLSSTLTWVISFEPYRDFIFGMHTELMKPFQLTTKSMTL